MVNISARKWLVLPIETKVREFDGKFLLSLEAAAQGWGVILGKGISHREYLPKGVIIENSISPTRARDFHFAQKNGRRCAAWCEEGLIYLNSENYKRRRVEKESYDLLDVYFAWGDYLANDMVQNMGCSPEKMTVAGNPRFDIFRPEFRHILDYRVAPKIKKYGRYILLNTKFARYNNYFGPDGFIERLKQSKKILTPQDEVQERNIIDFQKKTFFAFIDAAKKLSAEFPDINIIIRPHPSENIDPWIELAQQHKNIFMENKGNVAEWIMGSELCIHNNCTTAVETYLLDKPVISYNPFADPENDTYLPEAVSQRVATLNELVGAVGTLLSHEQKFEKSSAIDQTIQHYVAGQAGASACDIILGALGKIDVVSDALNAEVSIPFKTKLYHLKERIMSPFEQLFYDQKTLSDRRYASQKFDHISLSECQRFLAEAQNKIPKYKDIKVSQIEKNAFAIY
jgi:surface carbohydrate biosynthesis protein